MIFAWLTAKAFLGLSKGVWLLAAVALLAGGVIWLRASENADDNANQQIGATVQREGDLRTTLERTKDANQARDDVRTDVDGARYDQCLRTARTPANCKRFLPVSEADQR